MLSIYALRKNGILFTLPQEWVTLTFRHALGGNMGIIEYRFPYGDDGIELKYTVSTGFRSDTKENLCYRVELETTPCNYGGQRYWFTCPLTKNGVYCGRRVAKLYLPPGAKYFGCRHCHDLSYKSRQETKGSFYWTVIKPLELMEKAKNVRGWKKQMRLYQQMERLQEHAEILEKRFGTKKRKRRKK